MNAEKSPAGSKAWRPQGRLFSRWTRRILTTLFILVLVFIFFIVPYGLSYLITHAGTRPMDRQLTATPATYRADYRDVRFTAKDGTPISGWYLPKENVSAIIIYVHGLFRSRQEMLERAAKLWQHGYAGVLIDLRRHGNSGGKLSSLGYLERLDVEAAATFIRDSLKVDAPIVGFGVSMGAAATVLAAADAPDIDALIIDSCFLSFEKTVVHHLKLFFGLPRFPLADELIFFTRSKVGFKNEDFDMQLALQKIGDRPMLFIAGEEDVRMPVEEARALAASAQTSCKSLVVIPGATHGAGYRTNPEMYEQAVLDFLSGMQQSTSSNFHLK
jgi:pimeloyl-ACP methyl ester carboxylesterase